MLTTFLFLVIGLALLAIAAFRPSSFYTLVVSLFLAVGFFGKALFHFVFGWEFIEPTGGFSDQWDVAFGFASAGLLGAAAAVAASRFFPVWPHIRPASEDRRLSIIVAGALTLLLVVATGVYALNYQFHILRIGFPIGLDVHPRLYAILSFIISWGALLGGMALLVWLIELRRWPYWTLVILASSLGFMASMTMWSRIQLLLYVLAATLVLAWRWRQIRKWWPVAAAYGFAVALFVASLAFVSIGRSYDFVIAQTTSPASAATTAPARSGATAKNTQPAANPRPAEPKTVPFAQKLEAVSRPKQFSRLLNEVSNLAVMRWVGLEGVMVAAGAQDRLGLRLFIDGLMEGPSAGKRGIYQKMSGDRYGSIGRYTFLTLPGPVGVGSYSGSYAIVFGFMFLVILAGHAIEWLGARLTQNAGVAAVSGVSVAYLTVQMCYPWTLLFYGIELALSVLALGLFWFVVRKLGQRLAIILA